MDQQFSEADVVNMTGAMTVEYRGTGSFGETWRIETDGQPIARKFLHKPGYDVDRLAREVEGLRRVESPHVVALLDVGETTLRGWTIPYMNFEFVPGGDLKDWIDTGDKMADDEAVDLATGLLQGLAALHAAQVVHRDIKPANIGLRNGDPRFPVVLDLGLAKLLDLDSITRHGTTVGTAMYMSPEQFRGDRHGKGMDVWAVGVVLHEVLSGEHPFFREGDRLSHTELLRRLDNPPPPPPSAHPALQRLVTRCLLPEPYQRGNAARALIRFEREVNA